MPLLAQFLQTVQAYAHQRTHGATKTVTGSSVQEEPPIGRRSRSASVNQSISEEEVSKRIAAKQQAQCNKWKQEILDTNPKAKRLMEALEAHGCRLDPAKHIRCLPCTAVASGGFGADFGILLCQNQFISRGHMEDTLIHELIHAYDHCVFKYDWMNCQHFACTEVRAANLSGDCGMIREMQRGNFGFAKQHQNCVRRRAILATQHNPKCRDTAEQAVDAVFAACMADTRPFTPSESET